MTAEELKKLFENQKISDEEIFQAYKRYSSIRTPVSEAEARTITVLSECCWQLRPRVMERMRAVVNKQHRFCCMPQTAADYIIAWILWRLRRFLS